MMTCNDPNCWCEGGRLDAPSRPPGAGARDADGGTVLMQRIQHAIEHPHGLTTGRTEVAINDLSRLRALASAAAGAPGDGELLPCWRCPVCGFAFSREHHDDGKPGVYSCPACAEAPTLQDRLLDFANADSTPAEIEAKALELAWAPGEASPRPAARAGALSEEAVCYFVLDGDGTAIHARPHVTLDAAEAEAKEEQERRPFAPPPSILRCAFHVPVPASLPPQDVTDEDVDRALAAWFTQGGGVGDTSVFPDAVVAENRRTMRRILESFAARSAPSPTPDTRDERNEMLRDVATSGVELDDIRLKYVVVQIDRDVWERTKALFGITPAGQRNENGIWAGQQEGR